MGYIRGRYNAFTPYHLWHKVQRIDGDWYVTNCGLQYHQEDVANDVSTFEEVKQLQGDRCTMQVCHTAHMVGYVQVD